MEEYSGKDFITIISALLAGVVDYFINHPATAVTTVIMLMITWERYKARRSYRKRCELKEEKEEVELRKAKLREQDMLARMKAQDEEDERIRQQKLKENE